MQPLFGATVLTVVTFEHAIAAPFATHPLRLGCDAAAIDRLHAAQAV